MHSQLKPVQAAGAEAPCQVLQSGSGFTVDLNNGAPVSREGNKRFMQLLKESLQIHSVVARHGYCVDAFTVAW